MTTDLVGLTKLRVGKNLTVYQLARASGVAFRTICNIESRASKVRRATIAKLAKAFEMEALVFAETIGLTIDQKTFDGSFAVDPNSAQSSEHP